jgi:assimilatory nitrate reductase catalytic subunit
MGGREVGGLANQLAAHMAFPPEDVDCVRRFWNAPGIATKRGLKAVDLFEAVGSGKVKAIWIAATNPAVSMPRANHIRDALKRCPFVVVSDAWPTDTSALANVVLPAAAWAEKDGTVTNSERRISRQRAFRAAPGAARPDWWMFAEVGRRMGWEKAFSYPNPASIFREHAALSAFENEGKRVFDIGALADCDDAAYDALEPTQWPIPKRGRPHGSRLFARGGFSTPDGRGRMVPVIGRAEEKEEGEFTLKLNTGRLRDQWHTMTRTGRVPHLMTHVAAPQLAIHPRDAEVRGLVTDALARVESAHGESVLRVLVTDQQRPGEVFVPMHWTDEFSSASAIDRLVHDKTDPVSGQPDLKGGWVRVDAIDTLWNGTLLRRVDDVPDLGADVYWSKAPIKSGFAFDLAGWTPLSTVINSELALRPVLQIPADAELVSYSDPKKSVYRYAGLVGGELQACLFLAPAGAALPAREAAMAFLGRTIEPAERLSLLAAAVPDQAAMADKIVCACFSVGTNAIVGAIRDKNLQTAAEIGAVLKAGTNCGSCIPELKKLLQNQSREPAALTTVD